MNKNNIRELGAVFFKLKEQYKLPKLSEINIIEAAFLAQDKSKSKTQKTLSEVVSSWLVQEGYTEKYSPLVIKMITNKIVNDKLS